MRIYIVRHGKAVDQPNTGGLSEFPCPEGFPTDWNRPLTESGETQARYLAEQLRQNERRIGFVLTSPYPRAIQTARILTPVLNAELKTVPELEVDRSVSEALRLIDSYRGSRAIMLVGHNPQLGELISVLCAGLPPEQLFLKTGELVTLDMRAGSPIGSARLIARLRLSEDAQQTDSTPAARHCI